MRRARRRLDPPPGPASAPLVAAGAARAPALAEISRVLAEVQLDDQAALDTATRLIGELFEGACVLRLLSDDGEWLAPAALYHRDPDLLGLMRDLLSPTPYRVGEGLPGRVAASGEGLLFPAVSPDELRAQVRPEHRALLETTGVSSLMLVPLRAQGRVVGTVAMACPVSGRPYTEEDQGLLQDLADHLALAVTCARFRRANASLIEAYDATLEGWVRALDLRGKETEGHTRRVTELAVRLACALGVSGEELAHIRRGALLHDIGKMGVPDPILLKPGPLTEQEQAIMRRHPIYALELLSAIPYLGPALAIPYGHHERWDGTGYPRKLKDDEIPLAARIFTVVDVWDALRSDRPYRQARSRDEALAHLREEAGGHFDPRVVEAFLRLLEEEGNGTVHADRRAG